MLLCGAGCPGQTRGFFSHLSKFRKNQKKKAVRFFQSHGTQKNEKAVGEESTHGFEILEVVTFNPWQWTNPSKDKPPPVPVVAAGLSIHPLVHVYFLTSRL